MKRTFFKLGQRFRVESATSDSRFTVEIDVEEWKGRQSSEGAEDWHFEFKTLEEGISVPPDKQGTIIEIDRLRPSVAESFGQDPFVQRGASWMSLPLVRLRFVVQEHHARTRHFDFRLEKDGVFTLHGERLHGRYELVAFKRAGERAWLIFRRGG